ncbi:UHRF1-binding protein 1-like isoform X1 [Temnothorax curvispinosus]|uniref:UHRF1-binding protein 1-like isoform X1 n=1 Tax=Temnothorax curvispinosus TaxID=300111 RepID=A0A6J1QHJ6_9HYME|nr:UHRF1-binding protein 1-like isoform X1 [Temnothorax curvispinosus]
MVSIIKNQLLKHLSRFTKNLSADKINLSTFKGEGELSNLELDETVLTDLLELPSWLRLTNAWCNKVSFRIQWTKLKSVPIFLSLDEVHIDVETCEDLRSMSSPQGIASYAGPAKYSFIHKVIDGITIAVNTVLVTFKSPAFIASVQMNRIMVESKSATWQRCDLRTTRVKDPDRGQLLIFKELEWQTVRIEAQSTKDHNLTPLRLLTNQARCRITIKKRISDCFVMGSRLVIILDDLLWVLTDSQLKAALHFLDSLGGLIEKATVLERKTKAARKLEVLPEYQAQVSQQQNRTKSQYTTAISKIFTRYDVVETSYHFLSQRIDLHLCDDAGGGRSLHPDLKDGGALQISLVRFQIDYYPYHLAMADRKHWPKYRENATPHNQWLQQSLSSFRSQFMDLIDSGRTQHSPLTRSQGNVTGSGTKGSRENLEKNNQPQNPNVTPSEQKKSQHPSGNPVKNYVLEQLAKLMTTCIIIRIDDFTLYKVTTTSRNPMPKEFISAQTRKKHTPGDRDRFSLPEDVTILHAEFTYYYYPGDITFPLPPPKFYVQLNPIQINFDVCSCLWFNSFALNLYHSLMGKDKQLSSSRLMYFDVKIEAILPRIVFESQQDYPNQKDRPKSLHLQTSRASITNVRSTERSSRADLAQCLNAFQMGQMFFGAEFPSKSGDFHVVTDKFLAHCAGADNIRQIPPNFSSNSVNELLRQLNRELLWTEAKDVWCCNLEPVWGDFFGARAVGQSRPVPFLDAFPLTLWCHFTADSLLATEKPSAADIHGLAYISNLVSVQINHYQYLFLLRLSEILAEMATYLAVDSNKILKVESGGSVIIGALIPQVEVTFVMPSHTPGKENSGGDLESVMPDSSSIADDFVGSSTVWHTSTVGVGARVDFSAKRMNTSNDVETPQSEASSMLSMDYSHSAPPVVTFKQNGTKKGDQEGPTNAIWCIPESSGPQYIGNPSDEKKHTTEATHKHSKSDSSTPFIPNNFNVNLSSMKKGFSNLMTSIDSALKASPEDGSSDTVSMRSDVSSDSENYVLVSLQDQGKIDAIFGIDNSIRITAVEEATEVVEETPDTQSEKSMDSVCKRKDIVSMATFKLSKVEFIHQSCDYSSIIKVQVSNIDNDECSSIPWDEFQVKRKTKFSSRSRGWIELPSDSDCRSRIKLRLDHSLKNPEDSRRLSDASQKDTSDSSRSASQDRARLSEQDTSRSSGINVHDKENVMNLFENKLEMRVANVGMSLSMSSVTGLADLAEDEIIPKPIPMQIHLENISLRLNEDRPPNNITSPGPIPIDLNISKLRIARDMSGVFHIEPVVTTVGESHSNTTLSNDNSYTLKNTECERELKALRQSSKQLKSDNEELRRRMGALERLSEENARLMRVKEESDIIRSRLSAAEDDIASLLEEKKLLHETISELQNQRLEDGPGGSNRASWSIKR